MELISVSPMGKSGPAALREFLRCLTSPKKNNESDELITCTWIEQHKCRHFNTLPLLFEPRFPSKWHDFSLSCPEANAFLSKVITYVTVFSNI
jgi:hypothetical protein